MALGTWHLALGTWHLALGTWHFALGTWLFNAISQKLADSLSVKPEFRALPVKRHDAALWISETKASGQQQGLRTATRL